MKFTQILEHVAGTLGSLRTGGRRSDPELAALDRGVLTVTLLIAGLDGTILPEEYRAFESLAQSCRGGSRKNVRALLDGALGDAGRLVAMAQVGVYTERERLDVFAKAAAAALPTGFDRGTLADLRRAFALWVAMGVSDGRFSDVERKGVEALVRMFAEVETPDRTKRRVSLLEEDFFENAERIVRNLATPSRREQATADLETLVGKVRKGDGSLGNAADDAVNLAMMAMVSRLPGGGAGVFGPWSCM